MMPTEPVPVLEQKINAHEKLSDADKVEMQQYICGLLRTLTTFNVVPAQGGSLQREGRVELGAPRAHQSAGW